MKRLSILLVLANALLALSTLGISPVFAAEEVPDFCCRLDSEFMGRCCWTCDCGTYDIKCHVDSQCPSDPPLP